MTSDGTYRRELTALERKILAYIEAHPACNVEDVAMEFHSTAAAHHAIQYLIWNLYVYYAPENSTMMVHLPEL